VTADSHSLELTTEQLLRIKTVARRLQDLDLPAQA
jgi:hypothetical protein